MSAFGLDDIDNIEGEAEMEDVYGSLQRAINSLTAWRFQGFYGRSMMEAIELGFCMLGTESTTDYYGNRIPSRYDVKEGTKGSRGYVVLKRGEIWAKQMEEV